MIPGITLLAQTKLKSVQVASVWAPADVKIDGNLEEWDNNFQAENKAGGLFYTLSNNNLYLYLAVTGTNAKSSAKLAAGGLTFTINTDGKKTSKDAFTLTYPVILKSQVAQPALADTVAVSAAHKAIMENSKIIKVSGFKDLDDTLISTKNDFGILTAISFKKSGNYCFEVAIPLKEIFLTIDKAKEIAYNIKVNGSEGAPGAGASNKTTEENKKDIAVDTNDPVDFWGKYTFAKNK